MVIIEITYANKKVEKYLTDFSRTKKIPPVRLDDLWVIQPTLKFAKPSASRT